MSAFRQFGVVFEGTQGTGATEDRISGQVQHAAYIRFVLRTNADVHPTSAGQCRQGGAFVLAIDSPQREAPKYHKFTSLDQGSTGPQEMLYAAAADQMVLHDEAANK